MPPTAHVYVQSGSPRAKRITRGNLGQGKERRQRCGLSSEGTRLWSLAGLGAWSHLLESSSCPAGALRNLEKLDTRPVPSRDGSIPHGVMSPHVTTTCVIWGSSGHLCSGTPIFQWDLCSFTKTSFSTVTEIYHLFPRAHDFKVRKAVGKA